MVENIEEKILDYLENNSDVFHPSQVKPIVYSIFGGENITNANIVALSKEVYDVLCLLEKKGLVKNENRLPKETHLSVGASRWILSKK